jgi:hypothetical protein
MAKKDSHHLTQDRQKNMDKWEKNGDVRASHPGRTCLCHNIMHGTVAGATACEAASIK